MPPKKLKQSGESAETAADIGPLKETLARADLTAAQKDRALCEFAAKQYCDKNRSAGINKLGPAVKAAGKTSLREIDDLEAFFRRLIQGEYADLMGKPIRFADERQLAGAKLAIGFAVESGYLLEAAREAVKSIQYPRARKQNNPEETNEHPANVSASGHSDAADVGEQADEARASSVTARAAEKAAAKGKKRVERSPSQTAPELAASSASFVNDSVWIRTKRSANG
jgi:hypothetical protein